MGGPDFLRLGGEFRFSVRGPGQNREAAEDDHNNDMLKKGEGRWNQTRS